MRTSERFTALTVGFLPSLLARSALLHQVCILAVMHDSEKQTPHTTVRLSNCRLRCRYTLSANVPPKRHLGFRDPNHHWVYSLENRKQQGQPWNQYAQSTPSIGQVCLFFSQRHCVTRVTAYTPPKLILGQYSNHETFILDPVGIREVRNVFRNRILARVWKPFHEDQPWC